MIGLLKYHKRLYLNTGKIVLPFGVWICFLIVVYGNQVSCFAQQLSFSRIILFLLMVLIGYSYMNGEAIVADQVMIMNVGSMNYYNLSKNIFIILISIVMSFVGMIYPLIRCLFGGICAQPVAFGDILTVFLCLSVIAIMGGMVGALFHPRIVKNRSLAPIVLVIVIILSFVKDSVVKDFPIVKYVEWMFPPVLNGFKELGVNPNLCNIGVWENIGYISLYSFICLLLQMIFLCKNKY